MSDITIASNELEPDFDQLMVDYMHGFCTNQMRRGDLACILYLNELDSVGRQSSRLYRRGLKNYLRNLRLIRQYQLK